MSETIKIKGIYGRDVDSIMFKLKLHGLSPFKLESFTCEKMTIVVNNNLDPFGLDTAGTMEKIQDVLYSSDYGYKQFFDESEYVYVFDCNKKYDTLYDRCRFKDILNSSYGYLGDYVFNDVVDLNQAFVRINDNSFKMYSGIERATGKFKTTVVWGNGHKETVTATKPIKGYTPVMIFAYALAKRKFRTNSHFKKYVDKHTSEIGEFYIFYDEATYRQATVKKTDKKYDIYDMAALSIAIMEYGKELERLVEEATK